MQTSETASYDLGSTTSLYEGVNDKINNNINPRTSSPSTNLEQKSKFVATCKCSRRPRNSYFLFFLLLYLIVLYIHSFLVTLFFRILPHQLLSFRAVVHASLAHLVHIRAQSYAESYIGHVHAHTNECLVQMGHQSIRAGYFLFDFARSLPNVFYLLSRFVLHMARNDRFPQFRLRFHNVHRQSSANPICHLVHFYTVLFCC